MASCQSRSVAVEEILAFTPTILESVIQISS
jgi:hypothetical protein